MRRTILIAVALFALAEVATAATGAGSSAQPNARKESRAKGRSSRRGGERKGVDEDLREKHKDIQRKRSQKRKLEDPQAFHDASVSEPSRAEPLSGRAGKRRLSTPGTSTSNRATANGVDELSKEQADESDHGEENNWGQDDEDKAAVYSEEEEEEEEEDDDDYSDDDEGKEEEEEEEEQKGGYGGTARHPSGRVGARAASYEARHSREHDGKRQPPPRDSLASSKKDSGGVLKSMGSVTGKSMKAMVHALQPKSVGLGEILDTWKLEQVIGKPPGRVTRCAATVEFRRDGTVATSFDGRESVSDFTFKAHAWPRACTIEFEARAFQGPWDEEPVWKMYKGSFSRKLLDSKIITLEGTIYDVAGKLLWKRRVKSGKFNARRRPSRLTSSRKGVAVKSENGGSSGEHAAGFDRGRGPETGGRRGSATGAPNRGRRKGGGTNNSGGDERKSSRGGSRSSRGAGRVGGRSEF